MVSLMSGVTSLAIADLETPRLSATVARDSPGHCTASAIALRLESARALMTACNAAMKAIKETGTNHSPRPFSIWRVTVDPWENICRNQLIRRDIKIWRAKALLQRASERRFT